MIDPPGSVDTPGPLTTRVLRQFAALWIGVFSGLAGWQWVGGGHATLARWFLALALSIGLLGLVKPATIRPLFITLLAVTYPIGWGVSHVLLGAVYFGVFTPVAVLFRLMHRDALSLRRRADAPTYWRRKPMPSDVRTYLRES